MAQDPHAGGGQIPKPGRPVQRPPKKSVWGTKPRPQRVTDSPRDRKPNKQIQQRNQRIALTRMGVRQQQAWLRRMGFNVSVDGKEGPQTKAARKAFMNGVAPGFWNSRWKKNHPAVASNPNRLRGPAGPIAGGGGGGGGGGHVHGGGGGGGGALARGAGAGAPGIPGLDPSLFDPEAYANSVVASEFDPAIAELKRQIVQAQAQGSQNVAEIGGWYKELEGDRSRSAQDFLGALGRIQGRAAAEGTAVQGLFGGPEASGTAADLAPGLAAEQEGLAGASAADATFDERMRTILAAQGVDERTRAQREASGAVGSLRNDLIGATRARGAARGKALQEGYERQLAMRGQLIQQRSAEQAMRLAEQMAPLELETARTGLATTRAQSQREAQAHRQTMQEKQLQMKIDRERFNEYLETRRGEKAGSAPGDIPFRDLDPRERATLADQMVKMLTGAKGNIKYSVMDAWNRMGNWLRMAGYDPRNDAEVNAFRNSVLRTVPGVKPSHKFPKPR